MKLQTKRYIITTIILFSLIGMTFLIIYLESSHPNELEIGMNILGSIVVLAFMWWMIYNVVEDFIK